MIDGDLPVEVSTEAFNPLIPGDADASGMPFMPRASTTLSSANC